MACTITGPLKRLACASICSIAARSWPSTGPTYLRPRSSKRPWGASASLTPFFIACRASYAAGPTLHHVEHGLVARVGAQPGERGREAADRRGVGAAVVVDDDDQLAPAGDR